MLPRLATQSAGLSTFASADSATSPGMQDKSCSSSAIPICRSRGGPPDVARLCTRPTDSTWWSQSGSSHSLDAPSVLPKRQAALVQPAITAPANGSSATASISARESRENFLGHSEGGTAARTCSTQEARSPSPSAAFLLMPSRSQSASISDGGVHTSLPFSRPRIPAARLSIRPANADRASSRNRLAATWPTAELRSSRHRSRNGSSLSVRSIRSDSSSLIRFPCFSFEWASSTHSRADQDPRRTASQSLDAARQTFLHPRCV